MVNGDCFQTLEATELRYKPLSFMAMNLRRHIDWKHEKLIFYLEVAANNSAVAIS